MASGEGGGVGEVPVGPFRDRFLRLQRQGMSTSEVARRMGWFQSHIPPDTNRVNRVLGLKEKNNGHGYRGAQGSITVATAQRLCEALDMDPHEAGL